jgi:hypothetical protein
MTWTANATVDQGQALDDLLIVTTPDPDKYATAVEAAVLLGEFLRGEDDKPAGYFSASGYSAPGDASLSVRWAVADVTTPADPTVAVAGPESKTVTG